MPLHRQPAQPNVTDKMSLRVRPSAMTALAFVGIATSMLRANAQLSIPSVTDTFSCNLAELPDRIRALDAVCCFQSAGNTGARCSGVQCDVACAAQLLPLLHECHP